MGAKVSFDTLCANRGFMFIESLPIQNAFRRIIIV